jgi:integrase
MTASRIRPLTSKEVEKLTSVRPLTIKHHGLGGVPGLVLVHTPSDYVGFALIYRHAGKRKKLTLGSSKMLSLAEARRLAANYRAAIEAGGDPHGEKTRAREEERERERLDSGAMWDKYLRLVASGLRSKAEKERIFRRYILPIVSGLEVSYVRKAHVLHMLDPLTAAGKLRMADKVRQEGAAWFQWLLEREHVERNPFAGLRKAQVGRRARTRVLDDLELRHLWQALEGEGRWGNWLRLLILTGARNMEGRGARWSEFDFEKRIWKIPGARAKNKTDHSIHLSDAALAVLADIPRFEGVELLFPAHGNPSNPMSGDQRAKDRIDKWFRASVLKDAGRNPEPWCIHDLRRTVATGIQRLGFRPDIAEQVIGHVSGIRVGAAAHYLHHTYNEEKKQALNAWGRHVSTATACI